MELNTKATASTTAFRHHHRRKLTSSERFLNIPNYSHHPPPTTTATSPEAELTEHDIFCSSPDFSTSTSTTSSTLPTPTHPHHLPHSHNYQGILAALPGETDSETRSVFNHKASSTSVSSPSTSSSTSLSATPFSSSSRLSIPKRPPAPPGKLFLRQSAPVNVPVLSDAIRRSREAWGFDEIVDDSDEEEEEENNGEIMPPHEIVAAKQSPMLAYSVLEGVGRTLKGRDLRQVRNAVWRKTGFLD